MNEDILELVARVIGWFEPERDSGPGHPPTKTVRVLVALRRFLRKRTPWRSLRATGAAASCSTLRRRLALRCDRFGFIVEDLLQAARILLVAPRLARES